MKKKIIPILLLLVAITLNGQNSDLLKRLSNIEGIRVENIDKTKYEKNFNDGCIVWVKQPIDHNNPNSPTFEQRVWVCHKDFNKQMVMVTEGYAANNFYVDDLTKILSCNQIFVEHRFFSKSSPKVKDWKFLTVSQAAADHHHINEIFKKLYPNNWLSTGISKGGSTTMLYKRFYPNDIQVWVPIVGPFNTTREDQRLKDFFNHVGTPEIRSKVLAFQRDVLRNRSKTFPLFMNEVKKKKFHFLCNNEKAFECCVLEFEFAFFQWGYKITDIPTEADGAEKLMAFLLKVASPSYFSIEGSKAIFPFFVQAFKELGYYGYNNNDSLTGYLKKTRGFQSSYDLFIPKKLKLDFDYKAAIENYDILQSNNNNMIIINGEYDPWSATGFIPKGKTNSVYISKAEGSHTTRILNLPNEQREIVLKKLEEWLNIKINRTDSILNITKN